MPHRSVLHRPVESSNTIGHWDGNSLIERIRTGAVVQVAGRPALQGSWHELGRSPRDIAVCPLQRRYGQRDHAMDGSQCRVVPQGDMGGSASDRQRGGLQGDRQLQETVHAPARVATSRKAPEAALSEMVQQALGTNRVGRAACRWTGRCRLFSLRLRS